MDLAIGAADQVPVLVLLDSAQEAIGQRDGIVGILPGDGEIGFGIPVGVINGDFDIGIALTCELDDALDGGIGDQRACGPP